MLSTGTASHGNVKDYGADPFPGSWGPYIIGVAYHISNEAYHSATCLLRQWELTDPREPL